MKKAAIIIGRNINLKDIDLSNTYVIGVERGCLAAIKAHIDLDVAVGDFDSVSRLELRKIYAKVKKVVKLNPIKDETDTAYAYHLVSNYDKISILGGIQGKRIEHFLAILNILKEDKKVEIKDDNSYINSMDSSDSPHIINNTKYKYVSIFAIEEAAVTLENFKYPLKEYILSETNSLGISNEVAMGQEGIISLTKGRIMIIQSKADN
jgi:thiamine pyrophosphokinase